MLAGSKAIFISKYWGYVWFWLGIDINVLRLGVSFLLFIYFMLWNKDMRNIKAKRYVEE